MALYLVMLEDSNQILRMPENSLNTLASLSFWKKLWVMGSAILISIVIQKQIEREEITS